MKKLLGFLILVALLSRCTEHDTTITAFKLIVPTDVPSALIDNWVVVRNNETGELIDFKPFEAGQTLEFKTNKVRGGDKLFVSLITVDGVDKYRETLLTAFSGVDVGSEWTFFHREEPVISGHSGIGRYSLTVTDVPSVYALGLSDKWGDRSDASYFENGSYVSKQAQIYDPRHLISIDPGFGNPRYMFLDDLTDLSERTVSYNDFKEFDKVINFTFPATKSVFVSVDGYEGPLLESGSYVFYNNISYGYERIEKSQLNFGFLNSFQNYRIKIQMPKFNYLSNGPMPSSIEYVGPDQFNITDKSLENYSVTTSQSYTYRLVRYEYSTPSPNSTSLYYYFYDAPETKKHHDPLTPEIVKKYSIPADKLKHLASHYYIKGESFSELIDLAVNPASVPKVAFVQAVVTVN